MRFGKSICMLLSILFFGSMIIKPLSIQAVEDKKDSIVEIDIKENKTSPKQPIDKETEYEVEEARPVRLLPETNEVITAFIYIIIGLSIILFVIGILVNRMIKIDVEWE